MKTENNFIKQTKFEVMKKLSLLSVISFCFLLLTFSVNATGLRTEFSSYEIESVDDLYVGKKVEAIWTLSYSTDEVPVTVVKRKTSEGAEYVVHSKFFEVSYATTKNGFGAKEVRKSWCNVDKKISKAVLSQEEMARQQIITPNKLNDQRALDLIASYLPDLVNDGYTHLLN